MTEEQYIKERVDNQAKWHSDKAVKYKKIYYFMQINEFLLSLSIPILAGFAYQNSCISFVLGIVGALIALIESLCKLCKYHENWIKYRIIAETLKSEKYLYLTKSGFYSDKDFSHFVGHIEQVLATGNREWLQMQDNSQNQTHS